MHAFLSNLVNRQTNRETASVNVRLCDLKKTGLDGIELRNYRPVSNLPFLSKLLEKVRIQALFDSNGLMPRIYSPHIDDSTAQRPR